MCLACVARPDGIVPSAAAAPSAWTAADTERAEIVYRQLPRWSRMLFDVLSAHPGRNYGSAELRSIVLAANDPFGIEDACGWAADFCAAAGRCLPVSCMQPAGDEPRYQMDEDAAQLFRGMAEAVATARQPR